MRGTAGMPETTQLDLTYHAVEPISDSLHTALHNLAITVNASPDQYDFMHHLVPASKVRISIRDITKEQVSEWHKSGFIETDLRGVTATALNPGPDLFPVTINLGEYYNCLALSNRGRQDTFLRCLELIKYNIIPSEVRLYSNGIYTGKPDFDDLNHIHIPSHVLVLVEFGHH